MKYIKGLGSGRVYRVSSEIARLETGGLAGVAGIAGMPDYVYSTEEEWKVGGYKEYSRDF